MEPSASLTEEELEDLQLFLKDWLRHTGRTQADLRRALRASSIRMPVLVAELQHIHASEGLGGLAQHLCEIESLWLGEDSGELLSQAPLEERGGPDAMDQLDLLLDEIRSASDGCPSSLPPMQDGFG